MSKKNMNFKEDPIEVKAYPASPSAPPEGVNVYAVPLSDYEEANARDEPERIYGLNGDYTYQQPQHVPEYRRPAERADTQPPTGTRDSSFWIQFVISTFLCLGIQTAALVIFFIFVVIDSDGNTKPFKPACFSPTDMDDNVCFFSAGLISKGLISVGLVNIGVVCLGQVSIGIIFSIGQVSLSCGYSFGQIASGFYIPMAQIGFGLYKVSFGQIVFQSLVCIFPNLWKRISSCYSPHAHDITEAPIEYKKPIMCNECDC
jgi:hypothetical protein